MTVLLRLLPPSQRVSLIVNLLKSQLYSLFVYFYPQENLNESHTCSTSSSTLSSLLQLSSYNNHLIDLSSQWIYYYFFASWEKSQEKIQSIIARTHGFFFKPINYKMKTSFYTNFQRLKS
jgi:hypothetical protein